MAFRVVKETLGTVGRGRGALLLAFVAVLFPAPRGWSQVAPSWAPIVLTGDQLGCLDAAAEERVALVACAQTCTPIPWQLDERGADGDLLFDQGTGAGSEEPARVIDANDEVVFMAGDTGRQMRPDERPAGVRCTVIVSVDAEAPNPGWVYALVFEAWAPRSAVSYVHYDAHADTLAGARVRLGFSSSTPRYLALTDAGAAEVNLLDRLKVRASAWFLGLIPMGRDEDDLEAPEIAWRAGPIRIVRRQRQRIRLGWGIRSPRFTADAYFYRDFARLPVALRLNFPPTYFFRRILVRAVLDFRDLRGWQFWAPGMPAPIAVGAVTTEEAVRLNTLPADAFVLIGPDVQLVQVLETSESLATVTRRLVYRESVQPEGPESVPGEMPGVGYALTDWEQVGAGNHWFAAVSYAQPLGADVDRLLRERSHAVVVETSVRR